MVAFLFLVGTFALGVFLAFFFSQQNKKYAQHVQSVRQPTTQPRFSRKEVAKHNTAEDLWVIIKMKDSSEYRVYDLSSYVDEHPGGDRILNHAGGDSTEGFHGPQHPPRAFDLIEDFCIGTLEE